MSERTEAIRAALGRLDKENDDDWTEGGLPKLARMQQLSGFEDLKRAELSDASPGFQRVAPKGPAAGFKSAATSDAPEPKDEESEAADALEKANELRQPNSDPETNDNVGRTDLGPYEGQTHTADQGEKLAEEMAVELWTNGKQPADLAAQVKDPVFLIEAAYAAMSADPRYSKNGEMQTFFRHYTIAQVNIKASQARLDARHKRIEDATS